MGTISSKIIENFPILKIELSVKGKRSMQNAK